MNHGGAYMSGSGPGNSVTANQAYYTDGRGLALSEDVIVINVNYRLGTLGFLSGIDDDHRGNFGVRDQQMAIEWTYKNIEFFGGDKEKITILQFRTSMYFPRACTCYTGQTAYYHALQL